LSWSRFEHLSRRATTPEPVSDSGAVDAQELIQFEAPFSFGVGRAMADGGVALRRESIAADRVPGGRRTLHSGEPYLQLTVPVGGVSVTSGARVSVHERWGSFVAPRLAVLWRPRDAVGLRASLGRGYRAPDFKELHLEFANTAAGYAVRGNPDLVPERSTSLGVNATLTGTRASARVGFHRTSYRDLIESVGPDSRGTYTYANTARGLILGIESEGVVALGAVRLEGGYAWLRARDARTDRPLLGRAEHSAKLGLTVPVAAVSWTASVRWMGRTPISYDPPTDATEIRDGFTTLDVSGSAAAWRGVEVRAAARNLLDQRPGVGWPGFAGRQYQVAVRVSR
jgi:outer membrane receptor for ferrienterochelin and colicins